MDKPKDTLGLLKDKHQHLAFGLDSQLNQKPIFLLEKYIFATKILLKNVQDYELSIPQPTDNMLLHSDQMIQQDNPRAILSQSQVNAPNILQLSQQSQKNDLNHKKQKDLTNNQYKKGISANKEAWLGMKNIDKMPFLRDSNNQYERKATSLDKESNLKQSQLNQCRISKDQINQINDQRRFSQVPSIGQSQIKGNDNGQQASSNINNNLQTPRCREENSATTKDSLGIYLSSQKKPQNVQSSPSDKIISQYNSQFSSLSELKQDAGDNKKQTQPLSLSSKILNQPDVYNSIQREEYEEGDKFRNIEVSLNSGPSNNLKGKNYYSRARTAQENLKNQISDQALKKDSKTIDIESLGSSHNLNVDLIQDQKLILNHLHKQKNNSQQCDRNQQQLPTQQSKDSKDYDGANMTFYPRQCSTKTNTPVQIYDQKETHTGTHLQKKKEQKKRNTTDFDDISKGEEYSFTDCAQIGGNRNELTPLGQPLEEVQRRSSKGKALLTKQQQQNLQNKIIQQQQQQMQLQQQQSTQQNHISTQPEADSINNLNNNINKQILSEGQQIEQFEQVPINQMKFHNLYQKNMFHSKNNSLSQGVQNIQVNPLVQDKNSSMNNFGLGMNLLDLQSNNVVNSSKQQSLLRQQINQQRNIVNGVGSFKRQIPIQNSRGNSGLQLLPTHHQRSNSHHIENSINTKNGSMIMMNQFDSTLKDYIQQDLQSIKGRERCNISVDQIMKNDISNKYYSDNKFRNLSGLQQDNMTSYKKAKRNETVDILVNNNFHISNNENSKNSIPVQGKSSALTSNQHLNQLQQTFSTNNQGMNSGNNPHSAKKLSDICLPSLDQLVKPKNAILNSNDSKKITLTSLKMQPITTQQNQTQPLQLGIDKFIYNAQKNIIKINSKNIQTNNPSPNLALENKTGIFGAVVMNNNHTDLQNNKQEQNKQKDSSQIIKKNLLNPSKYPQAGNSLNSTEQDSNQGVQNQEQISDQILEETGRFGPEQTNENGQQKKEIININPNIVNQRQSQYQPNSNNLIQYNLINREQNRSQRNSVSGVQFDQGICTPALKKSSQSTHNSAEIIHDQNQSQNHLNSIHKSSNISSNKHNQVSSHVVGSAPIYNNSGILMTDGSDMMQNLNGNPIINIPVITTNLGLNNSNGNKNNEYLNQGTLLIHYNFPLADNLNDRSKLYQHQQKQLYAAQNSSFNNTQKKVSSAISCKRKDDFYSQFGGIGNDPFDKQQQRARSSNNRFPREIFTPNVQKAKRMYNQNRLNLNPNSIEQQNEFI